jgi:Peptide methionine sulfoxide reductase
MAETEKAILAGGCFWGVQDLIRKLDGVTGTRVAYTGGDTPNATYRNHGSHAEAIEILFDPDRISCHDLLEFFFQIHDPRDRSGRPSPSTRTTLSATPTATPATSSARARSCHDGRSQRRTEPGDPSAEERAMTRATSRADCRSAVVQMDSGRHAWSGARLVGAEHECGSPWC